MGSSTPGAPRRIRPALESVLEDAQVRGFLGPGPVDAHIRHAEELARLSGPAPDDFLDLGSGAGVPGLVLALVWPEARATLLDASQRRCEFLADAAELLALATRTTVRCGRAEELARDAELRESTALVVARGFGRPAVVAECAVAFVRPGGSLVVSEPPDDDATGTRWPADPLQELGLRVSSRRRSGDVGVVVLRKERPVDDRWPRRTGVPQKRTLW